MGKKAVCLLSGGMDSSTLAYYARSLGYEIYALHFMYGQRTEKKELACAKAVAESLDTAEFLKIALTHFSLIGKSSLTDKSMKVEDFEEGDPSLPNTYVPFRNANLLSIATSFAEARGAGAIFIGVQSSDYAGYPDCRPEFIEAFQKVIDIGTSDGTAIRLMSPFVKMNKTAIIRTGIDLGVPYELTWSCYKNNEKACGRCSSCHFRLEAFANAGIEDPLEYEVRE